MDFLALIENLSTIEDMKTALQDAIEIAGGITALARAIGVKSHSVINQWRLTQIPAEHCPAIEAQTGVLCEKLRPDVQWSVLRAKQPKTKRTPKPAPQSQAEQGA